ncbi:1,6-anhydro-N-acetylmuramyl-L-alanine amidase AmpD [Pseudoalteromonas fenneropenaei]|uniref:1,6-anhydro-N-acetylmuramyl-L-alanine amidase AmpD n=1 Tax=Pseudoalteromonas fenneropenaei TaxID=1737459 RepID=A0ABV7CL69_9GAMM
MEVKAHQVVAARCFKSPHYDERPLGAEISLLVVHCISLPRGVYGTPYIHDLFMGYLDCSADDSFVDLRGVRVSAHGVIDRLGVFTQYVDFDKRAWHAGPSSYAGVERCNDFSIGIELEGVDDGEYTQAQYHTLASLTKALLTAYPKLTSERIVGHSDIAPGRKTDPGMGFDWTYFRALLA